MGITWTRNRNFSGSTGETQYVASTGHTVHGRNGLMAGAYGGSVVVREFNLHSADGKKIRSFTSLVGAKHWLAQNI